MASTMAVERRRANRAARSASAHAKREQREAVQRETARRMVVRFYGGHHVHLMQLDYRYWQARSCGWDPASKELALSDRGTPCSPHESSFWRFWVCVHWRQREELVTLSNFRLVRHQNH
jgi:hypothetical protein